MNYSEMKYSLLKQNWQILYNKSLVDQAFVKNAYQKIIFLFLNQNICCGYLKEPSH